MEGLQALKSLQSFLELSATSPLFTNILAGSLGSQARNTPLTQSVQLGGDQLSPGFTTGALGDRKRKQMFDLYGNPIPVEKNKPKIPFENAYVDDCYKFIVLPGNNSGLIRRAMEKRSWWIEIQPVHSLFNFRWQPVSNGIRFDRLGTKGAKQANANEGYGMANQLTSFNATMGGGSAAEPKENTLSDLNARQAVNHFEAHQLITEKFNLLNQMQKYCDLGKENVFDYLPVTFYVEMPNVQKEQAYNQAMAPFISYF